MKSWMLCCCCIFVLMGAGPFGLDMGTPLNKLNTLESYSGGKYEIQVNLCLIFI